jgi:phosphoribosylaminoimidazole (AIR) synthetase
VRPLTYREVGGDSDAGEEVVRGFAPLATATDGVGGKLEVAVLADPHHTIGELRA